MKAFLGGVAGAVAVAAIIFLTQAGGFTTNATSALVPAQAALANEAAMPLVNCGDGRQAITRQVVVRQQIVPQVECVALAAPVTEAPRTVVTRRVVVDEPVRRSYRSNVVEPTYTSYAPDRIVDNFEEPREVVVKRGRSWKKSALIIGGTAAGGAGIGALVDGGGGAKKGAVVGGVAGLVYDLATRNK